jgi:hypothetical protein
MLRYDANGRLTYPHTREAAPEAALDGYLQQAHDLLHARVAVAEASDRPQERPPGVSDDFEALRWFDLPAASLR